MGLRLLVRWQRGQEEAVCGRARHTLSTAMDDPARGRLCAASDTCTRLAHARSTPAPHCSHLPRRPCLWRQRCRGLWRPHRHRRQRHQPCRRQRRGRCFCCQAGRRRRLAAGRLVDWWVGAWGGWVGERRHHAVVLLPHRFWLPAVSAFDYSAILLPAASVSHSPSPIPPCRTAPAGGQTAEPTIEPESVEEMRQAPQAAQRRP